MLVGKDHAGCGGLIILQKYDFCTKKQKLCTERTPMCPFATRIAADTMFFRPRSKSKGRLAQKIAHVEIAPNKYRKKRLLEAGLYMFFTTGTKFRQPYIYIYI